MHFVSLMGCVFIFLAGSNSASSADLTKIDRTIRKEPAYKSKPKYCLLVFGPEAKTRVWLVLDGDVLYVDRNGNGDFTEEGEKFKARDGEYMPKPIPVGPDPGQYCCFAVAKTEYNRQEVVSVSATHNGKYLQRGSGFVAGNPREAPVIWFGGPLTLLPIGELLLTRGLEAGEISICVGTRGIKTSAVIFHDPGNVPEVADFPTGIHPVAEIEFPRRDLASGPIKGRYLLEQRDAGSLFHGPVRVPAEAGVGKAKVTLSFPDWKEGKVAPATFEVPVVEPDPKKIRENRDRKLKG